MLLLTEDQVTEFEPHKFLTEASELGFRPGSYPAKIPTNLGNGQNLYLVPSHCTADAAFYRQEFGCVIVLVAND